MRYVVEGSVRKMGSRIRITAQLIDAVPGNHLWSERFDRGIEELFEVQDELTQTIVATVAGRLEDAEIRLASNKRTDSLPAYDCLLRGIAAFAQTTAPTTTVALANCSSRPWPSIRDTRWPMPTWPCRCWSRTATGQRPMPSSNERWTLATAAVRLDPLEGRCHTFLGQVHRFRDEYDLAISHLERGVELNPNDAIGMLHLGAVLGVSGRAEEGIEIVHRAIRLDPYLNFFWGTLALCLYALRRYEEALAASRKAGARASRLG